MTVASPRRPTLRFEESDHSLAVSNQTPERAIAIDRTGKYGRGRGILRQFSLQPAFFPHLESL